MDGLEAELSIAVDVMLPTNRLVAALTAFQAAYPTVARILRVGRDNLAKTIASLERRVSVILERMEQSDDWRPAAHLISNGRRSNAEQTS